MVLSVVLTVVLSVVLTVVLSVVLQMEPFKEVKLKHDLKEGTSAERAQPPPAACMHSAPAFLSSSLSPRFSRPLTSLSRCHFPRACPTPPSCSPSCCGLSLSFLSPRVVRG